MKNRQHKIRYSVATFVVGAGLITVAFRGLVSADASGSSGGGVSPTVVVIAAIGALLMIFGLMVFLFALATSK